MAVPGHYVWAGRSLGVVLPQVHEPFCRRDKGGHPSVFSQQISNLVGQVWMSHLTCSHSYWWFRVQLFFGPFQAGGICPLRGGPKQQLHISAEGGQLYCRVSLTFWFLVLMFRQIYPKILFAFSFILSM